MSRLRIPDLPPPKILESLDLKKYEDEYLARLEQSGYKNIEPTDPAFRVIKVLAYSRLLIEDRINKSNLNSLLAFTEDPQYFTKLQQFKNETDEDFKARIKLNNQSISPAGTDWHYKNNAILANSKVEDVEIINGVPDNMLFFYVLSKEGNGSPSKEVLADVKASLSNKSVKIKSDRIEVLPAGIVEFYLDVTVFVEDAPLEIDKHIKTYFMQRYEQFRRFGSGIDSSRIYSNLLHNKHVLRAKIDEIGLITRFIKDNKEEVIKEKIDGESLQILKSQCLYLEPDFLTIKIENVT